MNRENSKDDNKLAWGTPDVGENKLEEEPKNETKIWIR